MPQGKTTRKAKAVKTKAKAPPAKSKKPKAAPAPPPQKASPAMPKSAVIYSVIKPVADLLANPDDEINITQNDSQLLFGESFKSGVKKKGWLFGVSLVDGYEGWVHESALRPEKIKPTHVVDKALAHIYPKPDFKTRPVMTISFMSRIVAESGPGLNGFAKIPGLGWMFKTQMKKISDLKTNTDPLSAAVKFLGSPYTYGGRSALGLDCSGLTQLALSYCGIPCPRDSGDQITIGKSVSIDGIMRGDLVFFKGHVGIAVDRMHVLNATARTMDTRIERLEDLAGFYKGVIAIRRAGL